MRLFFLGTAAAEGYPGIFCDCPNCSEARALGGRSLRFRSAALINDDLLIDAGPDLLAAAIRHNRNLSKVTTGLLTHPHGDHFQPFNFEMRGRAFTGGVQIPVMRLYGPAEAGEMLRSAVPDLSLLRLEAHPVTAFQTWADGPYTFTALRAFHAVGRHEALFYAIEEGPAALLYATDTGTFPEDTWAALEGRSFDVIVLEETLGSGNYEQHLGFETFLQHAAQFRRRGLLRPGGRLVAHHFSHSGNPTHEKLVDFFAPHGVEVAYDGMEIQIG